MSEGGSGPLASVVIPSGRGARLGFALESLAAQTLDLEAFEVVVVRDPRAPAPPQVPEGLRLSYLHADVAGNIAHLRNRGCGAARAPLVVFTDDDCRAHPDWLKRLLAAAGEGRTLVQGRTEPDPAEVHLLHGLARSQRIVGPSPFFQTCNLLYPRALIEELGGFDEHFGSLGEDADLAYRALAAGAVLRYVDDAVVWHGVIPRTLSAAMKEAWRRDTMPSLVRRHPALRDFLYGRLFWRRSHALGLLAGAGFALAGRSRWSLLLAMPYTARALDPRKVHDPKSLLRRLLHLPSKAAVDAVEVGVTLRASVRERTLLL